MPNLTAVLHQLDEERSRLTSEIARLNIALSALKAVNSNAAHRRGTISVAGRAKIAAAQRARWARTKGRKVVSINSSKRRKLSATALANIRAAQKSRWAKWRKSRAR